MASPFIGEIRLFSFNFPPRFWATCDGQLLPIAQNQALFSLLGTMYGGNGTTTFALPDLRGRAAMHRDGALPQGAATGSETHTLTTTEMPAHSHTLTGTSAPGRATSPANAAFAIARGHYGDTADATLSPVAIAVAGGSLGHENRPPHLVVNFCIALSGIFPSRN